jgi:subtilisin family serine protease
MRARPVLAIAAAILVTVLVAAPRVGARAGGSDPALAQRLQWPLEQIGAQRAWPKASGTGTTIAIVDSGADLAHEDLAPKVIGSVSCIGADGDPRRCKPGGGDDDGHGTHVAGIAAAATGNGKGVAGVAPGASLLIVRALEHTCDVLGECTASGTSDDVVAAIRWAADHGADVINLSLGSTAQAVLGPPFAQAVRDAWAAGAIPVVAAGNGFVLSSGFADEPAVVVAATTREDTEATYSNGVGQARWGIAAPGGSSGDTSGSCMTGGRPVGVLSTYWLDKKHNQYACLAGTSMAAPHVAGAAALYLQGAPGSTPQQVRDGLFTLTTKDIVGDARSANAHLLFSNM